MKMYDKKLSIIDHYYQIVWFKEASSNLQKKNLKLCSQFAIISNMSVFMKDTLLVFFMFYSVMSIGHVDSNALSNRYGIHYKWGAL